MSHFIQFRYKWKNIIYGWLKLIATLTFIDLYRFILQAVSSLEGYRCFKLPTFIWLQFKYMNCLMRYKYIPKYISLKKSKLCTKIYQKHALWKCYRQSPDCLWSMKMPLVLALLVGKWTQCHDYRSRWWTYTLFVILFHRAGTKFSLVTQCKPGRIHQIGKIASAFGRQNPESGWRSGRLTGFSRAGLRSSLVVVRAEHIPAEFFP